MAPISKEVVKPNSAITTYSRFVHKRINDCTLEKDQIDFRIYGTEAERLLKEGKRGGTLSSRIYCWLKRLDYPIIYNWHKLDKEGISYHIDHGEGLDNYHVRSILGCGSFGDRRDTPQYVLDNSIKHNRFETGSLRTSFELDDAPWKLGKCSLSIRKGFPLSWVKSCSKGSRKS